MAANRRPLATSPGSGVSAKTVSRVLNDDGPVAVRDPRTASWPPCAKLGFQPNLMARNMRVGGPGRHHRPGHPRHGQPVLRGRGRRHRERRPRPRPDPHRGLLQRDPRAGTCPDRHVPGPPGQRPDGRAVRRRQRPPPPALRTRRRPARRLPRPPRPSASPPTAWSAPTARAPTPASPTSSPTATGGSASSATCPPALYTRRERFQGYRDALEAAGLPFDRTLVATGHDAEAAARPPCACSPSPNPRRPCSRATTSPRWAPWWRWPEAGRKEVALVGFDDLPLAEVLEPPLTVVAQDPEAIGVAAADRVLFRLDGDRVAGTRHAVPTRLIVRGSGEQPPRG